MTQPLIMYNAHKDVGSHFAAIDAAVQALSTVVVVAAGRQQLPEMIDSRVLFIETEWGGIVDQTVQAATLAGHGFDHHSNCHTRGETVRIEHDVGY